MKINIVKRARRDLARIEARWRETRPAAADLLAREFRETVERLRTIPGAGSAFPTEKRPGLRRILMEKTDYHVYFVIYDRIREIRILVVWGAWRGRTPTL